MEVSSNLSRRGKFYLTVYSSDPSRFGGFH